MERIKSRLKYLFVILWLGLTVSLAIWWMTFSFRLIDQIAGLSQDIPVDVQRQKTMLMWEGGFWILLLVIGALTLVYFIWAERKQRKGMENFVASFSHDLRTSMASLRLQAESLLEDLGGNSSPMLGRMIKDTVRLDLHLENSLQVARGDSRQLIKEQVPLSRVLESMKHHWPDLVINVEGDAIIDGDSQALDNIFKNLIQNSIVHGRASEVDIKMKDAGAFVELCVSDNGQGFKGNPKKIGRIFYRHSPKSGSGVGLHIIKENTRLMKGEVDFKVKNNSNFEAILKLPGSLQ